MQSRLKLRPAASLVVIGVLLTFQNCAQPADSSNDNSSYTDSLPFAFNTRVDTIGYMSCSGITADVEPRAYFSYRVGAYNNKTGGIALTPEFIAATQYYANTDRGNALSESTLNSNTILNLAVRASQTLMYKFQDSAARVGYDIDQFLPSLTVPDVAGPLAGAASGVWMNYFPGNEDQRLVEASLRFYEYENVSQDTRNDIEGNGATPSYLAVTYSNSTDLIGDPDVRRPAVVQPPGVTDPVPPLPDTAYGVGYRVTFGTPYGWSSMDERVLGSIAEYDLRTHPNTQVASSWNCSTSYQFMVVRPEDYAAGLISFNPVPDAPTAATQPALNSIRRVLRVEDWFVDLTNMRVMPKRTGDYCYGPLQPGQAVDYAQGACTQAGAVLCPHFVSVCIRN